jgi:hypothetical protein
VVSFLRTVFVFSISALLSSCAALYNIDDPTVGVIAKDQLPAFQKAVRCELVTFIRANKQRKQLYEKTEKVDRELAVDQYRYFDLDPDLFGAALLDLKVIDTVGLPSMSASNFSNKLTFTQTGIITHSQTLILNPSLTDQNTYEWQWLFLVPQNATIYGRPVVDGDAGDVDSQIVDPFQCYRAIPAHQIVDGKKPKLVKDYESLARGQYPQYEQFKRIRVNGDEPFAAWLEDNGSLMGTTFFAVNKKAEQAEHIVPVQMYYNFAIQISGGLNASFSLISSRWNPLAPVATASQQQTNNLQVWFNGPDSALGAGAKTGTAQVKNATTELPAVPGGLLVAPPGCTKSGCLIAPVPLIGPSPSPQVPQP